MMLLRKLICIWFALLMVALSFAQDREKPAILPSDTPKVLEYLSEPAAGFRGHQFLNPTTGTPWYSDGTNWRDVATIGTGGGGSGEQSIILTRADGTTVSYVFSDQTTRNNALSAALGALTDGDRLNVPTVGGFFQLSPTNISASYVGIDLGENEIHSSQATQDYVLRLEGHGIRLRNFVGRAKSTAGDGDFLRIVGRNCVAKNFKILETGVGNSMFPIRIGSGLARNDDTSDPNYEDQFQGQLAVIENFICDGCNNGIRVDSPSSIIRNGLTTRLKQQHFLLCESNYDGGWILIDGFIGEHDANIPGTIDNFGGINISCMEDAVGRFSNVTLRDVKLSYKGEFNPSTNTIFMKFEHTENITFDGVVIETELPFADTSSAISHISFASDNESPGTEEVENLTIRNSVLNVPISQFSGPNASIENIRLENSVFRRGPTAANYYWVNIQCQTFKAQNCYFADAGSHRYLHFRDAPKAIEIKNCTYTGPAGTWFLGLPGSGAFDINRLKIDELALPNGAGRIGLNGSQNALDNALVASKIPNTFNRYRATGGQAPGQPSSNFALSAGARGISDDLGTTNDYYWNGSSWSSIATGGGGGSADGVISNVALSGNDLDFTGSDGGFNGGVDLSQYVNDGVVSNVVLSGSNLNFTGSTGGFSGSVDLSSLGGGGGGGTDGVVSNVVRSGTDLTFTGSNGGFAGTIDLSGIPGGSADGVVSSVNLTGSNLNFTGSTGGFNGTVDLSAISASPNPLVHKTNGQQSQINVTNAFPDQASIGPPPSVVADAVYSTLSKDLDEINAYYSADKGSGLQWYAITGESTVYGIDDVLAESQAFSGPRAIDMSGNDFIISGGTTGNFTMGGVGEITFGATSGFEFEVNGNAAVQLVKQESIALTAGQSSIDVTDKWSLIVTSATTETITGITGGVDGQTVTIHITGANISVSDSSSLFLDQNDGNYTAQSGGAVFVIEKAGGVWREISRRVF